MLNKLEKSLWEKHLQQFMEQFQTPPSLKLVSFHPIQLPIVIAEAHVRQRSVQDFSVLSLLILRLFDAGISNPEAIQSICGLSEETVRRYITDAMYVQGQIDPTTNRLTEMGRETLEANENVQDGKVQSCQYYDSSIRVHVDPITASLIPQYLEWELVDNYVPNQEAGDFVKPRKSADVDESFRKELRERLVKEINKRKEEYVTLDAIQNGDILNNVNAFLPLRIFYRWGYLAKFEGMKYPMIALTGRLSVDRVNAESNAAGVRSREVVMPIALAGSDQEYLSGCGITFDRVISRDDECFDELSRVAGKIRLTLPDSDGEEPLYDPDDDDEDGIFTSSNHSDEDDDEDDDAFYDEDDDFYYEEIDEDDISSTDESVFVYFDDEDAADEADEKEG